MNVEERRKKYMKGSAPSQGYVRQNYGTLPPKNYGTLPTKSTSVPVFMLRQPTGIELINQQIDTGTLLNLPKINVNVPAGQIAKTTGSTRTWENPVVPEHEPQPLRDLYGYVFGIGKKPIKNKVEFAFKYKDQLAKMAADNAGPEREYSEYTKLTPAERETYNIILYSQGEAKADEYLKRVMRNVYEREGKRIAEGSDNPIKRFGVTATAGFASGVEGMRDAIKAAKRDATASPTSPFQVAHQINRSKMGGAEGTISDVAHSMANMAPSIMLNTVLPGSGTFAFGLSAGGNAYNQALQEGKAYNEALAYGLMKGTSEAALQKILGGVGALTGKTVVGKLVGDNIDEVIRSIAKSPVGQTVLKKLINMAGEFTEEYLQEILEPVFRNIAFGENNEFKPFTKEALYAGVLGALTSAAMGTVTGEDLNIYRENKTAKALSEIDKAYAGMKTDLFGADATKAREAINKVYNLPRAPKNYGTEYDYLSMKDHARSKIFVKDWSQIKDIEDYLRQNGIEFETDIVQNEWGYKGYHITFRNADGLGAEIQVTQPDVWEVKLKSDKIYEKWRDVDLRSLSPQEINEYKADVKRSNEMWNHLNLPDFSNFSNSASDSLRAENISSELTGPTAGTQEPLTNSKTPLPNFIGEISSNRPVSVKQAMSTPPTDNIPQSPTEVKSNQPQNATETAKGKPANVKNYGTAPKPMQTQEQMPQNYGTVPNAVNLPPKTTAQTEMQQNNINLPPAVENGLQGQNEGIARPQDDVQQIYDKATELQNALNSLLSDLSKKLGVNYENSPQKSIESMKNKVARKRLQGTEYDYLSMKDHARSKIFVKDWSQIKDIEDYLRQNGIEFETDIVQNEWGYKGYHITFRNTDGLGAEIQVTQPDVWEVKLKSDKIYEKWRDVDLRSLSPQEINEYKADIERSNEMWNHLNLPDFSSFSNSASDSLRALNISSPQTGLVAGTQEPLMNSNISLLPDGKTSNIRPVSVKQAMSTPPTDNIPQSPTEVKSNQPQNATETAKGKPANVKNYGTAPKPMQTETQEQMPQNYGTVPNAVNLPPKTTAQTEMQQNNINLPPAVENGLQGQNKNISIREQIKNNIDELKKMQAVSAVNPDTLKPGESGFMGNVINYFKSLGNIIRRPGFGDVIINERHLKGTLKYFPNKAEMAAFTAIPDVIRSGKQIYYNENQKSRGYASYTFAAPITIGNDTGIMAVVVTRPNESNYYKIHRVLTPDGKEFLLDTEKTLPVKNAGGKTVDTAITEAPISDNSVPQSPAEVKSNKPQNVMETVKDINRPTQQETGSQGQETGARKSVRELVGTIDNSSYNIPKISTPKDVYIDDNGNPLPQSKYPSAIRKYMLKLFRGKVLKIGKDHKVYVSKEGVEEFAFPVKRLSSDIKLAKYDAGANLDKTLEPAMFLVNVADDGSHPKATGGWDNFYVMFETESGIYSGIVKTMMTDRGRVFYDITEMQKEDVSRATRGDNEINSSPAMPGTSSELSVPQSPAEIKSNQPQNVTETVNIPTQQETGSQGQEIAEGLISKIEQSIPLLKHTQPVSKLSGQEFQKVEGKSLVEQVSGFFKSIGNKVANPQLGEVILNERGIKDSIAHGLGRIKAAAFLAVPDVIKGGEIVETQRQWKGRLYDTAVIVAPVEIGDDLHHVGVVVIKNPDNNRYYLHEVVSKKRRFNTVQDRAGK